MSHSARCSHPRACLPLLRLVRVAALVVLFQLGFVGDAGAARPAVDVQAITNPAGVRVSVRPKSRSGWGLLQVFDPKTEACLKTVHAGRISPADGFAVVAGGALPPGAYQLRYREGVELALAGEVPRPDAKTPGWLNPVDVVFAGPWAYVLDAGAAVDAKTPEQTAERDAKQPVIFKIDRQGKPDTSFGQGGRLVLPGLYNLRAFVVDPATGKLFVGSGSHEVRVYEADGTPTKQAIGGWDNDPAGPKCLAWCDSLALGPDNRIYIPLPGYGNGKVYERTKSGFDGLLYRFPIADVNGTSRVICSDARGTVYYSGHSQQVTRFVDDGKSLTPSYQSAPGVKLAHPTGGSASAGLVWWACHGPGFGPFWDSGGGGEVVLFWDTGKELKLIDRYGVPGTAADRAEFMNPSAAVMDAAHDELWVAEDGLANAEGPKGNARVRRFLLKPRYAEDVNFDLLK